MTNDPMTNDPEPKIPHAPKLVLIDASGFIFRAYHSLPPLSRPDGTPVGAVYGFVNMLLRTLSQLKADYVGVVFDVARVTFRNRIYAEYKAHRPPAPDDLIPQFAIVRQATTALNLPVLECADYEADDVIASYADAGKAAGMQVIIVSSDKDMMQCIGDGVQMWDAMKQKQIGPEQVREKFGVGPEQVNDVLALIGDSSDNVPGVPGIGPKTAAELILQFGSLETLLARVHEIPQQKRRETLMANAENARMSKELIRLRCDVPLPMPVEQLQRKTAEPQSLREFLTTQGFTSLLSRAGLGASSEKPKEEKIDSVTVTISRAPEQAPVFIDSDALMQQWLQHAQAAGGVSISSVGEDLSDRFAPARGVALHVAHIGACYVPLPRFNEAIRVLMQSSAIAHIGHDCKADIQRLHPRGIGFHAPDDIMLMSSCLYAGLHAHDIVSLAERYLQLTLTPQEKWTWPRDLLTEEISSPHWQHAAQHASAIFQLHGLLKAELIAQRKLTLYETLERPLTDVLARMEQAGTKVDVPTLSRLSAQFGEAIKRCEIEVFTLAGQEFNIGSPKQLGDVLFEKLKLEGGKKTAKSGAYSTDSETLEELSANGAEIAQHVLKWRQWSKLKSTYTDALQTQVRNHSGRVHTHFAMSATTTGRLSSSDPNLQNIPIRTEQGREIRTAFVADAGYVLLSADYSQIELRLLAHMAEIGPLREAFALGRDIHAATASQIFHVPIEAVDGELRRRAKTVNFGIIYGMSAHGLAGRLGIARGEAAAIMERYFAQYPGIQAYMERCKTFARTHGYVETLFGRRCYVPGIADKNPARRQFSERAAINAPLQGTAADIMKRAMIALDRVMVAEQWPAKLLLQVHDELVLEVQESFATEAQARVAQIMSGAAQLSVPLTVDVGMGPNWGAAH